MWEGQSPEKTTTFGGVITMAKKTVKNVTAAIVCIVAFLLAIFTPVPTVLIVILSGLFGILLLKMGRASE